MKTRIQTTFIIFLGLFALVIAKAFHIQIVQKEKLIAYANSQFVRETREFPNRGSITDRAGYPLAINVQTWDLAVFTKNKGPEFKSQLKDLSKIVPALSYQSLWNKVKARTKYTWLSRRLRLNDEQIAKIKKLNLIHMQAHNTRVYPNHELSAQLLGFTGIDNVGVSGFELFKNKELRGEPQLVRYHRDAKGRPVKFEKVKSAAAMSQDVTLSIDKELQASLENYLREAVNHHQASKAGAGVMDVETGEILAVANYPSFDPNLATNFPADHRKLAFVTDPFEPGSVFKTFTIAAALEHKVATPQKRYYCEKGKLRVQNHIIKEAEDDADHRFEWMTVTEILKKSSNVGTTKLAFDVKYPRFKETLLDFGIGLKTGSEFGGESKGILTSAKDVRPLTLSNISFGHGVATTGLQMLRAYAVIANGGYLIKPTFLRSDVSQITPENRSISARTAGQLTDMLVETVEEGTGTGVKIPHYTIAGKTGTAQRVSARGGYEGYVASFVGFPVNVDRRFVVFVYVDNPRANGYYGSMVAAPVFKKITQYMLYRKKDFAKFAKYNSQSNEKNLDTISTAQASRRVEGEGRMPNFIGMDKASALRLASTLKIGIELTGFGIVTSQKPTAGESLLNRTSIELKFMAPSYER